MEFSNIELKHCTLVRLGGRIDGSVAPELGSKLRAITDAGQYKLVLNMKTYPTPAGRRCGS